MTSIKFGTDGWRAVVGEDFIPENIMKVAQAFADLYPTLPKSGKPVAIGYDRRNKSPETAEIIASVLLGNGIPVILSTTFCPTPAVSWVVKTSGCTSGVMVTASHNPPRWNGIKFKEDNGGAASGEFVKPIEDKIESNEKAGRKPQTAEFKSNPSLARFDPFSEYLQSFSKFVDIDRIKKSGMKVMIDPLFGSGCGFFPKLLGDMVTEIHNAADFNFGGLNPEPIPPNTNELMERVKSGGFSCGILTDGDADRTGAVDENGNFVTTHEVFSLLVRHCVKNKKWSGKIIKSISTTMMIDRLGKKYGMPVQITPVGFKYISPAMKAPGVLVGGEESGGFGFPRHIPERDGVFSGLLLLELMATTGNTLGGLVSQLQDEFGPCRYRRMDLHLSAGEIEKAREKMKSLDIKSIGNLKVARHETMDGHHFLFEDESWLLFRTSGTEPLVRIYAEAPSFDQVEAMLAEGKRLLGL
ncbi:MAG: phosphoglucomutase/phosphomannomutase family protein [Pseudomonadota bacterium]